MAGCCYVDDGYNETGRINAVEGLHPEVNFSYRPTTAQEWMQFLSECDHKKLNETRQIEAKWLSKKLISWDIQDRAGNAVPTKPENCLRLTSEVFKRLAAIVMGQEKTDAVPLDESAKN